MRSSHIILILGAALFAFVVSSPAPFRLSSGMAVAMPVSNLATTDTGVKADTIRWVCNAWGQCWWRPNYYGAYAYYGPRRHYHRHWRHWHHW
jgi:hypothetical protein